MKQRKAFVKRMLTFALCLAMVLSSLSVPSITAMAATDVTDSNYEVVVEDDTTVESTEEVIVETTEEATTEDAELEETSTEEIVVGGGTVVEEETFEEATTVEETTIEEVTETAVEEIAGLKSVVANDFGKGNDIPELAEGYKTIFIDEFEGSSLDLSKWNREQRQPGWTNNELQEYTDSEDNSFVSDGKLVIQALKTKDANGNDYYTSGKLTTKNKVDFTYGKVEASIRVPSGGQGMWPAFWMMPTNEQFYGTWPKCGEIDIMEVLGDEPEKAYQTLHWGDPHGEKQGTMVLEGGKTFASDYHIFAVEWLPGEIIYTIDGVETHRVTDWYTKVEGGDEATFPAPFDQDFFLQLNLAVGGSWPGNPDETTVFGEGAQMVVDWVRVSQKSDEAYQAILDELEQPDRTADLRDPDENGNYVVNGNFSEAEDLNESDAISAGADWVFLTAQGGTGTATIDAEAGVLKIDTTNASDSEHGQTYSIQLVQPGIPLEQGIEYTLTFDAKADEARKMIVDISNTSSWSRYLEDTTVDLGTEWDTYTCTFGVKAISDENARLEFNLGKLGSVADVYLKNVTLKKTGTVEVEEVATTPDGNYVKNGAFEVGEGRLAYWNVTANEAAKVSVTNTKDTANSIYVRELKVVGAEGLTAEDVTVSQSGLALAPETNYVFTMDAYAEAATQITVNVAGETKTFDLTEAKQTVTFKLATAEEVTNKDIVLALGSATTVYVDNVSVKEDSLLVNGSFDNGMSGWTPYSYLNNVKWEVEKNAGNNVMKYTIPDTGNTDWYIQLKQENVTLENGKRYKLTFKAKSNVERDIQFAFQRDGLANKTPEGNEDWQPYSETEIVTVGSKGDTTWDTFSTIFDMTYPTDEGTILAVTLGAVGGEQISEQHEIYLDDFVLEETDEEIPTEEEETEGTEIIRDSNFTTTTNWDGNWGAFTAGSNPAADADITFTGAGAKFDIRCGGEDKWNIQLQQSDLSLEKGKTYDVKIVMESDHERDVTFGIQDSDDVTVFGDDITLSATEETVFTNTYTMEADTADNYKFALNLGWPAGTDDATGPKGTITVKKVSIIAKDGGSQDEPTPAGGELIQNGNFANGKEPWIDNCGATWVETASASATYNENGAVFDIENVGNANWHVQLKQAGINLEQGKEYTLKVVLASEKSRQIEYAVMENVDNNATYYGGNKFDVTASDVSDASTVTGTEFTHTFKMEEATDANAQIQISMGKIDETTEAGRVIINSVSLKEKEEGTAGGQDPAPEVTEGLRIEPIADQTYTGKAIKPAVVVYDGETLLVKNKDYTIDSYSKNTNVGQAKVTIKGKGNYKGTIVGYFNIVEKNLADSDITAADVSVKVNKGKVKNPTVTVKMGKTTLRENRDYVLVRPTIQKNKDGSIKTGQYEILIKAKPNVEGKTKCNFTGSRKINFTVISSSDISMSNVTVKVRSSVSYLNYLAGDRPTITATKGSVNLMKDAICKVVWPEEIKVGKKNKVTLIARTGSGFYGSKTVTFEVKGIALSNDAKKYEISGIASSYPYAGSAIEPEVVIKDLSRTDAETGENYELVLDKDYTVKYSKNKNKGTATATITGKGAYTGSIKKTFKITQIDLAKEGNTINVAPIADQTYTGKGIKPALTITVNGITLTKSDYTAEYKSNTKAGENTAKVKITLKGNFKGSTQATFTILPKDIAETDITKNASVNATLDKNGYVKNPSLTIKRGKITLEAGKDYKVTYPAFEKNDKGKIIGVVGEHTITVTGNGNYSGSFTIPYEVLPYKTVQMSKLSVSVKSIKYLDYDYEGKKTPSITVKNNGKTVPTDAYTVIWPETVIIGSKNIVTIKAKENGETGNYDLGFYGSKTVTFKVTGTKLENSKSKFTIEGIKSSYPYTGSAIEPEVTITDMKRTDSETGAKYVLKINEDYTVKYQKNVNAGNKTAKVIITGKGAYTGTITKSFSIQKETMKLQELLKALFD